MIDYNLLKQKDFEYIFENFDFNELTPRRHQYITMSHVLGENLNRTCFFHDMRTGKTLTALWTTKLWKADKTLVVCPSRVFSRWKTDCEKLNLTYTVLTGTRDERIQLLKKFSDIFIINYEGLKSIYGKKILINKNSKKNKWVVDKKLFVDNFSCIILDEVHRCKSYTTVQAKICFNLVQKAKYSIGLTGTPTGNNLLDLWNVVRTIDLGESLGSNYWYFRKAFFYPTGYGGYEWKPKDDSEEKILNLIAPISTSFRRDECFDLPGEDRERLLVTASEAQRKEEAAMMEFLQGQQELGLVTPANALVVTQKLRQIAGGFIYDKEDNKRTSRLFYPNPKLEVLEDIVAEIDEKIVIYHQYDEEGKILEVWAKKNKIMTASVRGTVKNPDKEIAKFKTNPEIKLLIANPACASEGIDLSVSSTIVFYSNSYSFLQREQAEARIQGAGHSKKYLYIDLIVENSIDEIVISKVETKKELSKRILTFIRTYRIKKSDD